MHVAMERLGIGAKLLHNSRAVQRVIEVERRESGAEV